MSPDIRLSGVPLRVGKLPGSAPPGENFVGANQAKEEKLRLRRLQRRVRDSGGEIRHSDYGYALIDAAGKPVDGRRDLSLKDVASLLDVGLKL